MKKKDPIDAWAVDSALTKESSDRGHRFDDDADFGKVLHPGSSLVQVSQRSLTNKLVNEL